MTTRWIPIILADVTRLAYSRPLGIELRDWRYLREQILEAVIGAPVRGIRITPFGVIYDVVVQIDGLNGATHPVVTVWLVEEERPPRLVTLWVDVP